MIDKLPKELCDFVKYLTPDEMIKFACTSKRYLLNVRLYFKYKRIYYKKNNIPINHTNSLIKINIDHYYYSEDMKYNDINNIPHRLTSEGNYEKLIQIKKVFEEDSRELGMLIPSNRRGAHRMYRCYYIVLSSKKKCGDKRYVYPDWNYLNIDEIKNEDLIPYK